MSGRATSTSGARPSSAKKRKITRRRYNRKMQTWAVSPVMNRLRTKRACRPHGQGIYQLGGTWLNVAGGQVFTLDMLPDWPEFTALFDQYRILNAEVKFLPVFNSGDPAITPSGGPSFSVPYITYAVDTDNATPPANQDAIMEYGRAVTTRLDKPVVVNVTPRVAMDAYKSGLGVGYAEGRAGQWIDCETPGVEHYGLKWWIPTTGPGGSGTVLNINWACDVIITLTVEFKNTI